MNKIVKTIPTSQTVWMRAESANGDSYLITSTNDRQSYLLYKQETGGYLLISKDKSPLSFQEIVYPTMEDKVVKHRKTKR